jgi:hypothetical protein
MDTVSAIDVIEDSLTQVRQRAEKSQIDLIDNTKDPPSRPLDRPRPSKRGPPESIIE